ncbi:hypothetical protein Cgig2_011324 [Carnegiea gigantea]|uniref:Uncharacterized protein n=1 Tax=Carnegiea gigantea TaxID=171969 RepID=A0A9Q1KFX5_9CARY|nr:hypothetical protein Cgig2_011324 [Carnegiea gigantea]
MASCSWVASELLAFFKENPTMDYLTMQNSIMERHGIAIPTHVYQRAKKLFKEWVEGKHRESYLNFEGVKLHLQFWTACNAYTKYMHTHTMDAIIRETKKAYQWLVDKPIEHWARFNFNPKVKYADNTTNFVESGNGEIEKYRYKSIFTMLEADPPVEFKRSRPQTERRMDITEKRKNITKSNTLKCSLCKQFSRNKRRTNKPSYKEKRGKRKVGRLRKEALPLKKLKMIDQPSSSQLAS